MRDKKSEKSPFKTIMSVIAAIFMITTLAVPADAGRGRHNNDYYWITAQSQFDFRTVSGPVRPGPVGDQVRLPGGTWLNCEYSCAYTLRSNTLDFFTCGEGGPDDCSPGILDNIIARRLR